ncbi:thiamine biosynthesis protein ThiC, partial [Pseudomonas sp. 2995-3]
MNIELKSQFPASSKVYVEGSRPDIKVPMREIALEPTQGTFGEEENDPVRVYDTSGPYTDPDYVVDVRKGLPPLRKNWILERDDVEAYEGREIKPEDNGFHQGDPRANLEKYPHVNPKPLRAKKGQN